MITTFVYMYQFDTRFKKCVNRVLTIKNVSQLVSFSKKKY